VTNNAYTLTYYIIYIDLSFTGF